MAVAPRESGFKGRMTALNLLTAGVALFIAGAVLILHEYHTQRENLNGQLESLGEVVAENSSAALAFHDARAGLETLRSLRVLPNIIVAALYDREGKLFASYRRDGGSESSSLVPGNLADADPGLEGQMAVTRPVRLDGSQIGSVLIRSDLDALRGRLLGYGAVLLAVLYTSLGVAYLLMTRLRRRLADAEESLQAMNESLEERVAERTQELEVANRELEAFSYSVSHDLRAPLRAINGFSQIILETDAEHISDEGKRMFDRVMRNSNRMGQLIDDILEYSRAGRSQLEKTKVDMGALAGAVAKDLAEDYPSTTVDLSPLPVVDADRAMLRQILENLIGNAYKYSAGREHPLIEIGMQRENGATVFFVRDNGVGFDMQYAGKLFGMFQRMHTDGQFPGTGVGLAIVKRLIERHGGRVWAESQHGRGSTFFFTLA